MYDQGDVHYTDNALSVADRARVLARVDRIVTVTVPGATYIETSVGACQTTRRYNGMMVIAYDTLCLALQDAGINATIESRCAETGQILIVTIHEDDMQLLAAESSLIKRLFVFSLVIALLGVVSTLVYRRFI